MSTKSDQALGVISDALEIIKADLVGRKAKILYDFRDQPYGRSKKNLKGEVRVITDACISTMLKLHIVVQLEGCDCWPSLERLEVLP